MGFLGCCLLSQNWISGLLIPNFLIELFADDEYWNRVRSDGNQIFSCFLSVTILEMQLVTIHRRNMLMCAEWYLSSPPFFPPILSPLTGSPVQKLRHNTLLQPPQNTLS